MARIFHTTDRFLIWKRYLSENTKVIVEIGSYEGQSTLVLHRLAPNADIYCIEPFTLVEDGTRANRERFLQATQSAQDSIILIEDFSEKALPRIHARGIKPDFIYVDGSHEYENVKTDIKLCLELFPDAILVGDDIDMPGVSQAVDYHFSTNTKRNAFIEDRCWVSLPPKMEAYKNILSAVTRAHGHYLEYQYINLIEHSKEPLHFRVFYVRSWHGYRGGFTHLSEVQQQRLKAIVRKASNGRDKITFYDVTTDLISYCDIKLPNFQGRFSPAAPARLLAPQVIWDTNTVLYLDSDVYALKDFSSIFDHDLRDVEVLGVSNDNENGSYINSGVLLMNLDEMRHTKNYTYAMARLNGHGTYGHLLEYPDQDVLNMFLIKGKPLPSRYNDQTRNVGITAESLEDTKKRGVVFEHTYGGEARIDSPTNLKYKNYREYLKGKINEYCSDL